MLKKHPSEAEIQKAFTAWLRWNAHRHPALAAAYRIKNDPDRAAVRGLPSKARAIRVVQERKLGQRDGMPDYCIPFEFPALYIEFKSAKGHVSKEQRQTAKLLRDVGHEVHFAFSVESAINAVENRLKRTKKCQKG